MEAYPSMVNRKCKYFNDPEKCALIQPEYNCYQCPIVEWEINKKDLSLLQGRISKLEKENHDLKIMLAEKLLKEREKE